MTAALRSTVTNHRFPPRQPVAYSRGSNVSQLPINQQGQGQRSPAPLQSLSSPSASRAQVIRALPSPQATPLWLHILLHAQRASSVLTLCLVASALTVYGWTVYSQQLWSSAYHRLELLQRQERQLTAANEVLKNQMAQEAEKPGSGLTLPDPGHTIFLQPAPLRQVTPPPVSTAPEPSRAPLGY